MRFLLLSIFMALAAHADEGMVLEGSILSFDQKELVLVTQTHRVVLDNTVVKHASLTENCHHNIAVTGKTVLSFKKLKKPMNVVCTNKSIPTETL